MTARTSSRTSITLWAFGSTLVAVVVLVVVLSAGGGAPQAAPGGLPDAGAFVGWGLPVVRLLVDLTGVVTVGLALVGSGVITTGSTAPGDALAAAGRLATAWAGLAVLEGLLHVSELRATSLPTTDMATLGRLVSGLGESAEARAMLVQAALALTVVWLARSVRSTRRAAVALAIALAAFVPQVLTGHAATGNRLIGSASLTVHVIAAALWVGGLAALAWLAVRGRAPLSSAVPRYSTLALGCVVAVALSGVVNAVVRVGSLDALFGTAYGLVVLAKAGALVILAGFGWLHRQRTVERLRTRGSQGDASIGVLVFVALASVELAVMAATLALAVGLSRTPPPETTDAQTPAGTRTATIAPSASGSTL